MKICMIAYSHYDTDNRIMRYAETLAARGDQVDVIVLQGKGDEPRSVRNGVNVFRILRRPEGQQSKTSYLFPLLKYMFRASWLLTKRHVRNHYDIVHVHSVPDFLVFAAWYPRLSGAKIILDIHDILPEFYASKFHVSTNSTIFKMMLLVERVSTQFAHHVIIANDIWRERIIGRSVPAHKCTTILNYPDRSLFRQRGKTRNDGKFIFMYPGSLNKHQGLDIAVRAFAKICNHAPEAEFHIYGFGPDTQMLIELARELQLGDRFVLREPMSLRNIVGVMESADVGVVPKRSDSFGNEAFSTKTLEFMSLGVPLIVANTSIDRYYFDDTLVRFFRSGDVDDLASAMLELIRQPERRQMMAHNALKYVNANSWDTKSRLYLDIVDSGTGRAATSAGVS